MIRAASIAILVSFAAMPAFAQDTQRAIFAGGCFWSVESDFDKVPGVVSTISGYIGGDRQNPTYENHEGFHEAVEITFDPAQVSYDQLVTSFFRSIDPTDPDGQFCDRGYSYTTAVYAVDDAQLASAQAAKDAAQDVLGEAKVVTEVLPAPQFWPAEEYHQNFAAKNALRYMSYRRACQRDARVKQVWGAAAMYGIPEHS
ncbi:peptide-methionine (S)-S-oxide reductase MsrA [Aliihoeflea sp. PC F10.4]